MRFIRRLALVLMASLLPLLLLATAINASAVRTFGNPEPVKDIIARSEIYKSVVGNTLDQPNQQISAPGTSIYLDESVIRTAAAATFTPQFIQKNTETVIDSIYRWLNGKTPLPDFYINLSALRVTFANNVTEQLQKQLNTLPTCNQLNTPTDFDAFNATCLPPQVSAASIAAQVKSDILTGQGFLDNPVITADSIKASGNNRSIFADQAKDAPTIFRNFKTSVPVLAVLSILVIASIILLSVNRRKGIRRVGIIMLVTGLLLLAIAWGTNRLVSSTINPNLKLNAAALDDSIHNVIKELVKSLNKTYWIVGATYGVLGAAAITGTLIIRPKNKAAQADGAPDKKEPPQEKTEEPQQKVEAKAQNKPKKIIVQ